MKKLAMSALEVLIAMSLMIAATVLGMNILHIYINKDTDVAKFKHAFASLSEVIYAIKNDSFMYTNTYYFADLSPHNYLGENITYGGEDKFKKLFTSKFNVLEKDVEVQFDKDVPLIKYTDKDGKEAYKTSKKITCFIENKGFMFCPPKTTFGEDEKLEAIYIPVYINKIDNTSSSKGIDKAIFVEVGVKGKIEILPDIKSDSDTKVLDCTEKKYNDYNHCKVLDKMMDMDF